MPSMEGAGFVSAADEAASVQAGRGHAEARGVLAETEGRVTVQDIVNMLAARHDASKAFFVDECKLGEQGTRRLDAWVLLKTWSPPTTIGYEVKVNRQDFVNDRKWADYLPVCHELYFACPAKLIAPEELPEDVGLLWTAGQRLVTKRKASRREPEPKRLIALMSYVLMSRAKPAADMWDAARRTPGVDYWRQWLEQKQESQRVGAEVSRRLRERLYEAERRARVAEDKTARCAAVEARLNALGLAPGANTWDIDAKVRTLMRPDRMQRIERMAREILNVAMEVA